MAKILALVSLLFITMAQSARAESGLTYELGGGVGYILQTESLQFKVLGSYYHDSDHSYNEAAGIKAAVAFDVADIGGVKLYVGPGFWDDVATTKLQTYQVRLDGVFGARYKLNQHIQIDGFVNAISTYGESTVNTYVDSYGNQHWRQGEAGVGFARTGAVSISYLF